MFLIKLNYLKILLSEISVGILYWEEISLKFMLGKI